MMTECSKLLSNPLAKADVTAAVSDLIRTQPAQNQMIEHSPTSEDAECSHISKSSHTVELLQKAEALWDSIGPVISPCQTGTG